MSTASTRSHFDQSSLAVSPAGFSQWAVALLEYFCRVELPASHWPGPRHQRHPADAHRSHRRLPAPPARRHRQRQARRFPTSRPNSSSACAELQPIILALNAVPAARSGRMQRLHAAKELHPPHQGPTPALPQPRLPLAPSPPRPKTSLPPMNWRWVEEGDGYVGRLQPPGQPLGVVLPRGLQCLVPYPYRRVDMQAVFSLQWSGLSHPPALLLALGRRDYLFIYLITGLLDNIRHCCPVDGPSQTQ
jgi:hypothetical protein